MQGELFRAHAHIRPSRANFFAHKARQHGDVETTNTTARPQQGTAETDITTAPENCAKNTDFSPGKAMAVSVEAQLAPAKAMAVSTHHRHERAKETGVSGNRAAWPTGPDHSARGRWLGQSTAPVGNIRYKRRQTDAIQIASRGPLLQTSSIQAQKPPLSAKRPMD